MLKIKEKLLSLTQSREPDPHHINMARERGATIKYVLETHFHADFISGHIDLAEKDRRYLHRFWP